MSPEVARAIQACLASAPGFERLRDEVEALGFFETANYGSEIRWTHAEGHEVFLAIGKSRTTCSVWFDGECQAAVFDVADLLTKEGYTARPHADASGTAWTVGDKRQLRLAAREKDVKPKQAVDPGFRRLAENLQLVKREGYRQRLCAALFVQRD
jgi:hypothetical protein